MIPGICFQSQIQSFVDSGPIWDDPILDQDFISKMGVCARDSE